jgi:hypothetical protein
MLDPIAIAAERDDWKRRAETNHLACEAMRRQLEECAEREAALEKRLAVCEMAKRIYFDESRTYRMGMERLMNLRCEGYIGEPI